MKKWVLLNGLKLGALQDVVNFGESLVEVVVGGGLLVELDLVVERILIPDGFVHLFFGGIGHTPTSSN